MPRISIEDQKRLIEQLLQLVAERTRAEAATRASFEAREGTLRDQLAAERQRVMAQLHSQTEDLQSQYTSALARIVHEYEAAVETALKEHNEAFRQITADFDKQVEQIKADTEQYRQRVTAEYEASIRDLQRGLHEFKAKVEEHRKELRNLEATVGRIVRRRYCRRKLRDLPEPVGKCESHTPVEAYAAAVAGARQALHRLKSQRLPGFLNTFVLLMLPVFIVTAAMLAAGLLGETAQSMGPLGGSRDEPNPEGYLIGAAIGALVMGMMAVVYVVARPIVVSQTRDCYAAFIRHLANADVSLDTAQKLRGAEADIKKVARQQQRTEQLRNREQADQQRVEQLAAERDARARESAELLQARRHQAVEARDARQRSVNDQFTQLSQQLRTEQAALLQQLQQREQQETATSREMYERGWNRLVTRWHAGLAEAQSVLEEMWTYCRTRFPDWNQTDWHSWTPPEESLPALKFGTYHFSLTSVEGGVPVQEELRPNQTDFDIPALINFRDQSALLWEASGEGRFAASASMQHAMLRLLTSLPPGKVRFTIIDPVGLGQNFSAFMHLADFDEKLVSHRIWTDSAQINARLTDLTEHMENVIQTYLRNEFASIDDYNRSAGEVAEPYHVLVVANFPAGFSDESVQRLLSIVSSGSRCGVYTLISTDSNLDWPRNFNLADVESHAATLQWTGRSFAWQDEQLRSLPLTLDVPPSDEQVSQIIRVIGQKAKHAARVEVPFSIVAAKHEEWWRRDSREGIEIPLGRAGASKLQYLRLGKGTSQHVLIAGKTGSGKSTLLHALITNTAIHYGPDEVEFYLIDFKKGVEFKPYASRRLPHARVIAIESEREFGMSVLERLDLELRERGDQFREASVQDIKGYRDRNPGARMPRVLLIIDEFQEFFTHDDKLAQNAALLLDRLVRQGRAFGIHVLLGSQTLAGAYSLARSTLGQMAVRIALQCSEADAHLILSEDNTAARLLRRPGEAIYNDANGTFEGNHPFQVVWLSAQEQEEYLAQLTSRAHDRRSTPAPASTIVFEGNAPADPAENVMLRRVLAESDRNERTTAPHAWLGTPLAIKEPTSAVFRRQTGANLLIVGQQEELALGMLATSINSLRASCGDGSFAPQFVVCDGTRPDSADAGWWRQFAEKLAFPIQIATPAEVARVMTSLATEVANRADAANEAEAPMFLVLYNLARFRDLRRSDDDLGFSGFGEDKPLSTSKQFANILRDGPSVGVHTLIWSDTYNTVSRWIDRGSLRELDQRVLFQMSANDSSNLMDSPQASRLGPHRALLYSEELGQAETFRPYGVPTPEWLAWLGKQFAGRTSTASLR